MILFILAAALAQGLRVEPQVEPTYTGHLDLHPKGRLAIIDDALWDFDAEIRLSELPQGSGQARFSPDGDRILLGTNGAGPLIVATADRQLLVGELGGQDDGVTAGVWSPDGSLVLDHELRVWSARTGELVREFRPVPDDLGLDLVPTPSGEQVLVAGHEEIQLRDAQTAALERWWRDPWPDDMVVDIELLPDGEHAILYAIGGEMILVDLGRDRDALADVHEVRRWKGGTTHSKLSVGPKGHYVAAVEKPDDAEPSVALYDTRTGELVNREVPDGCTPQSPEVAANGWVAFKVLCGEGSPYYFALWNPHDDKSYILYKGPGYPQAITRSDDGRQLAVAIAPPSEIERDEQGKMINVRQEPVVVWSWNLDTGEPGVSFELPMERSAPGLMAFDEGSIWVEYSVEWDDDSGGFTRHHLETGRQLQRIQTQTTNNLSALLQHGSALYAAGFGGLAIWDRQTGELVGGAHGDDGGFGSTVYRIDRQGHVLLVDDALKACSWDVADGRQLGCSWLRSYNHDPPLSPVCAAPDASAFVATHRYTRREGVEQESRLVTSDGRILHQWPSVYVEACAWSADGEEVLMSEQVERDGASVEELTLRSAHEGTVLARRRFDNAPSIVGFSPRDGRAVLGMSDGVRTWDVANDELSEKLGHDLDALADAVFSPRGDEVWLPARRGVLRWDLGTLGVRYQEVPGVWDEDLRSPSALRDPEGDYLLIGERGKLTLLDAESWEARALIEGEAYGVDLASDGDLLFSARWRDDTRGELWDPRAGRLVRSLQTLDIGDAWSVSDVAFEDSGSLLLWLEHRDDEMELRRWDWRSGAMEVLSSKGSLELERGDAVWSLHRGGWAVTGRRNHGLLGGRPMALVVGTDSESHWERELGFDTYSLEVTDKRRLRLWLEDAVLTLDVRSGGELSRAPALCSSGAEVSADGRLSLSTTWGVVRLCRMDTGAWVELRMSGDDWIVSDERGYFAASRHGGQLAGLVTGDLGFEIEQGAQHYNRPDLLLEAMGLGEPEYITHLQAQIERRWAKLGLASAGALPDLKRAPRVELGAIEVAGRFARVAFEAETWSSGTSRVQVWLDGAPVLEQLIETRGGLRTSHVVEVPLAGGEQRFEIAVTDPEGLQSLRAPRTVASDQVEPGLVFLGFGVSDYHRDQLDLAYAAKDVGDLAEVLGASPGRVAVHTWLDGEVGLEAVEEARRVAAASSPEDLLVLFVAGHGLYGREASAPWYYLPAAADPQRLAETAIPFAAFEEVLQAAPAQKRLLLLDTCESGERDPVAARATVVAAAGSRGLAARGARGLEVTADRPEPRPYVTQRDRYVYNDLRFHSGSVVVSASRADEFSYEDPAVRNGLFTEELIRVLTDPGVSELSTTELLARVGPAVAAASGNAQHPVIDRDNPLVEIELATVPEQRWVLER